MVISCSTSHGPRSMPVRTSQRGAGTRQAPCRQASHISSQEASNATERPASTRSSGPIGSSVRNSRASASTNAAAARWVTATPLGAPVEPEVKMIQASSSSSGPPGWPPGTPRTVTSRPAPSTAHTPGLAEHELGPLVRVVRVDRHVGRTRREHAEDRHVQVGGARRHPHTDPVAGADAVRGQLLAQLVDLLAELGVGERHRAVVERRGVRVPRGGLGEHVGERPRRCGGAGREAGGGGRGENGGHRALPGQRKRNCSSMSWELRRSRFAAWTERPRAFGRPASLPRRNQHQQEPGGCRCPRAWVPAIRHRQ